MDIHHTRRLPCWGMLMVQGDKEQEAAVIDWGVG